MCLMNPYFFSTLVQHPSFPISLFWIFHLWRIILNFHLKLPPSSSAAFLSYGLSPVVRSICHTAVKSSFHAIKQPQWLPPQQQQQQQPSVGERKGNHSIKPDGKHKEKNTKTTQTHSKKQQKTKTGPKQPEGKLIYIYSLCFSWSQTQTLNYEACRSVHFSYCWI